MKKLFALMSVLFLALALYAEDVAPGSVEKPIKGTVVLVGRVTFKNKIDVSEQVLALGGKQRDIDNGTIKYTPCDKFNIMNVSNGNWELEEPFYWTVRVDDDGTVTIPCFHFVPYNYSSAFFRMPLGVKIHIPEEASYVYIGNFQYDVDYALRVLDYNHYDEYDEAQEWINRATGNKVELYRGELEYLKD